MSSVQVLLLVMTAAWGLTMEPASAFNHIVGGSLGWNIPPSKTYYQDWAKPRTFGVQDKLVFPFRSPLHNVIEVTKEEFEECSQEKAIDMYYHGPLIVNFTQPGEHFYFSTIGTQCELGVKLHVSVVPGKGSSGRVFAVAPAPSLSATSSSSATTTVVFGVGFVLMGLVSLMAWMLLF